MSALVRSVVGRLPVGRLAILMAMVAALPSALFFKPFDSIIIHIAPALTIWWLAKAYWQKAET